MKGEFTVALLITTAFSLILNSRWRNFIKFYIKYVFFLFSILISSILGIPFGLVKPGSPSSLRIYGICAIPVSAILGIKWEIRNSHNLPNPGNSVIFTLNHQSLFDVLGTLYMCQATIARYCAIAKDNLFWIWPVGLGMWLVGVKFVRRTGCQKNINNFNKIAEDVFRDKVGKRMYGCLSVEQIKYQLRFQENMLIFVEGTRNKNPEKLLPFKKGAFIVAIKHQVPIQPMLISHYYFIDWKNKSFDSGKVIIDVMEPISTKNMTMNDLDYLIETTYNLMSKKNAELKNEIDRLLDTSRKNL